MRVRNLPSPSAPMLRALCSTPPRRAIYEDITQTVGRTPVVRINKMAPPGVAVYGKLEYFNPVGSVKDRLAVGIVDAAERAGQLKPGGTIVEATSGNTGISLAMVCAARGYQFVATMAASFSMERRKIMRMMGAKVIVTPAPLGGTGMVKKAEELAEHHGWLLARQFESEANAAFHAQTTGPEILSDFAGRRLDYWVTGYGTGGTFHGAGKILKQARPDLQIVLSEPKGAPLLTSGVKQERKEILGTFGAPAAAHPAWAPHPIQGWTPNFIPKVLEEGLNRDLGQQVKLIEHQEAIRVSMQLARQEGIFTGISGGATVATALEVARSAPKGSVILAMLPDTAERYLSTPLFAEIDTDMNDEEWDIARTTPTPGSM